MPVTYTLVVTNNSQFAVSGAQVQDVLPGNFTVTASGATTGTFVGSTWNIPSIAGGGTATLTITGYFTSTGNNIPNT